MDLAPHLELTSLRIDTSWAEVERLCRQAVENGCPAVCGPSWMIQKVKAELKGTPVKYASVANFPYGFGFKISKWTETLQMAGEGVDEIGIPLNISQLKSGEVDQVKAEVLGLGLQSGLKEYVLKIIVETNLLDFAELDIICGLLMLSPPRFVQISTVESKIGPDLDKVEHLRDMLPKEVGLKVAGSDFTYEQASKLVEMGVERIGTKTIITKP